MKIYEENIFKRFQEPCLIPGGYLFKFKICWYPLFFGGPIET